MTELEQHAFLQERANSLATIILTRRSDLFLSAPQKDSPLTMLADILKSRRKIGRQFGIRVSGVMTKSTPNKLLAAAQPTFSELHTKQFTFPVLLFVFTMPSDDGYLFWVVSPIVENGNADLAHDMEMRPVPLTTKLVNEVVTKIDLWYDAAGADVPEFVTGRPLSGHHALDYIIDKQQQFVLTHHKPPTSIRLPLILAYDLAKLKHSDIGELSQRVFLEGVRVFEQVGLLGMEVKIDNNLQDVVLE